jgi:hypothetical protein
VPAFLFFPHACYVLYASRPKIINAFVFSPVLATFSTLLAPKLCTFFFYWSCYVLYSSRPKIINAFVFIPYVLRSQHFLLQNYVRFFLPYMLLSLRFSSQNYKRIRIYSVRATFSTLPAPKLCTIFFSPVHATCSTLLVPKV